MSVEYQIPGGPFVSVENDGAEYQLPGYAYLNVADPVGAGLQESAWFDFGQQQQPLVIGVW